MSSQRSRLSRTLRDADIVTLPKTVPFFGMLSASHVKRLVGMLSSVSIGVHRWSP